MRGVIWLVLLFGVAVVAALTLGSNDGLVTVYWKSWRLDLSLNLFLLVIVGTCFALVTLIQTIDRLVRLPKRAREWRMSLRERSAQTALREALAEFFGARYSRAQKSALRALAIHGKTPDNSHDPAFMALGHVLAAGSAHRLQDRTGRDEQLHKALDLARQYPAARSVEEGARLLATEWALEDRDASRASALLSELNPGVARRTHALRLKLQATRMSDQPLEALRTARLLAKHQGFSRNAALGLLRSLASEALETARDIEQLRTVWQQLDANDRRDAFVAARATLCAAKLGAPDDGRGWLRPFWESIDELSGDERAAISDALVRVMAGLGPEWLPRMEAAAQKFPRDASVSFALGHALAERQLWGKARLMLEQAAVDLDLPAAMRRRCWLTLAELAERDGDMERRARCHEAAAKA
jgi:HemY protein